MNPSGSKWADAELAIVRSMYPTEPWLDIMRALPGRTKKGVVWAAREIGVKRLRKPYSGPPRSEAKLAVIARASAKRTEERRSRHLSVADKQAAARLKAAISGGEHWAQLARMREALEQPCVPGTCRASNGVTLAKPGQAHLYSERRA